MRLLRTYMRSQNNKPTLNEEQINSYVLDNNYTSSETIAGILVELEVSEVTIPRGFDGKESLTTNPTLVRDELAFRDVALAEEYTVKASGETVVKSGEKTPVRFLEGKMMEEVGTVRRVKEELMSSGFDANMSLDKMAQNSEDAVVQLYRNADVKNAELMVKAISFNAVEQDMEGTENIPNTSEIRQWVDETRSNLETAIEALEDIESLAQDAIGDEYENPNPTGKGDMSDGDSLTTDIDEIRKEIYDSDYRDPVSYADSRKIELPEGGHIKVDAGSLTNKLKLVKDDTVEILDKSQSSAEIVAEFNKEVNDRT